MTDKKIILTPSHKSFFWWYLLGIVLVPVFGLGIYIIYRYYRIQQSIKYIITDQSITARDSSVEEKIDLANVENVHVDRRWIDKKLGLGDLEIEAGSRAVRIIGMNSPSRLAEMILSAAAAERKRISDLQKKRAGDEISPPERDDRVDYLTGLWQQGLISEEDFLREKKHFEK